MRKTILFLGLVLVVTFYSCSDDMDDNNSSQDECEGTSYTYTNTIKSIIDSNCAISGCHDGSNGRPNFTTYSRIAALASKVASRTSTGSMPPKSSGRSLTDEQILMIKCWVDSGAPE